MQRYLSIVLGDNCNLSKTLISDNRYELDKYIFDNFKDSEEIRKKFKKEIEQFFTENQNQIKSIETRTNKMYRGQIVILQCNEDGTLKRIKVIYKKDVKKIKNELLTNQEFMQKFVYDNRKYFSPFIYNTTRRIQSKSFYENMMREFYKKIKDDASFFEFCRSILKFAEEYYAETKNKIVNNDVESQIDLGSHNNIKPEIDLETPKTKELQIDLITDDPDCDSFDPDWIFRPDLDDRDYNNDDFIDDCNFVHPHERDEEYDEDIKPKRKVKTYKRDPNQLSLFDKHM